MCFPASQDNIEKSVSNIASNITELMFISLKFSINPEILYPT